MMARAAAKTAAGPTAPAGHTASKGRSDRRAPDALDARVLAALPAPVAAVDANLVFMRVNERFAALFPAALPGTPILEAIDHPGLHDLLCEARDTGRALQGLEMEPAFCGGADDLDDGIYRLTATPLPGAGGAREVVVTLEDVGDRLLTQERLMEHNRLVSVGEMAAGVAHELNNPLTAVLGFSQLVLQQEIDGLLRRDLEAIAMEARRAGRIVDNLLSFTRRHRHEMHRFSAVESVRKVLELREYECRVNNVEVVTYLDDATPPTMADGHAIEQVFLNILNNAIQALADAQGRGTITIGTVVVNDRIRVSFADDGPGIPPDVMDRIFEPFYTTKPVGKGTGLGLSICKRIVEQHNGKLTVQSRPGKGAAFVVELPVVPVEETAEEEDPSVVQRASHTMLRVLVVDDERAITELVSRALGQSGHEVEVARDGAEALRLIHLNDYDAVLLDLKMPGLGGPEVYRCIQGLRPAVTERILFMTGDAASADTRAFVESTGSTLLSKPFNLEDLRRDIEPFVRAKVARAMAPPAAAD